MIGILQFLTIFLTMGVIIIVMIGKSQRILVKTIKATLAVIAGILAFWGIKNSLDQAGIIGLIAISISLILFLFASGIIRYGTSFIDGRKS